jgi:hypothetical protein
MGLERVAKVIFDILTREAQHPRGTADRIREETIDAVVGDGRYRIGPDVLPAKGTAALRVGQRVHVLYQQDRRALILTHHWKRAQPGGVRPGGGVAVVEQLILGTIDGTSPLAAFGGAGEVVPDNSNGQNVDLWFRNLNQVTALGLTAALVAAGFDWMNSIASNWQTRLIWGERDNTFALLVNDVNVSGDWTALIYELNREAGKVYGAADVAAATLLRSQALPTIALPGGGSYPSEPVGHVFLSEDLRLLGTTYEGVAVGADVQNTAYVLDLDAGTVLFSYSPALNRDLTIESSSIMRWGTTDADRWLVVSSSDPGAAGGPISELVVRTLAGVTLFTDTITEVGAATALVRQMHHSNRQLLYFAHVSRNIGAGPDEIRFDEHYRLVRPDVGVATELGSVLDFLFFNASGPPEHSLVIGRAWGLMPLRGDLLFFNADPIADPDVEQGNEAGWLNLANFSLATQQLLQRAIWPGPDERGRLIEAAGVSLASPFTLARADAELQEYPAGYWRPFPLDANVVVTGFTAYHLVNDPLALGALAGAAAAV